ncbi:MAG TPA: hypothetical protein VFH83_15395 [Spirochaetia bacterium]|nr:hypothetical protein [Spirochaetia bacterium]
MRPRHLLGVAAVLAVTGARLWALEGQALLDVLPTAALVQAGPSSPWMQSETTAVAAQIAVSHAQTLVEGLSISGTVWGIADSLPSGSPFNTPAAKVDLESRILELKLTWEMVPGALVWNLGKEVIHPSSGFSRTPLDVLSHGALADTANLTGSAVGAWEEGWIGTGLTAFVGNVTLADYFSPRLSWSSDAAQVLQYVTLPQSDYQNLTQVDFRLGEADIRVLGLVASGGPGSSDPEVHVQLGSGLDTALGDSVTIRAEICAADAQTRTVVTDSQLQSTTAQSVSWAPRALAGFTWTSAEQLSVMAEYYYNGAGFLGDDYRRLIQYTESLRGSGAPAALGLLDQLGTFSAAQHYGFLRVSGTIDNSLTAAAWTQVNLQDLSGLTGIVLTLGQPKWSVNASLVGAWGGPDTEAGLLPLLWRANLEVSLFF